MRGSSHYNHDNLGSTRRLRASDKSSLGAYEYTPYGQAYATSGVALGDLAGAFTGKAWDDTSQLYYFPYRYYSPDAARWLTRDPLGMVDGPNVYAYVKGNPATFIDYDGSFTLIELCIAICILGVLVFIGGCMFKGCKKSGMTNQEILSAILDVAGMPVNNIPVPPPGAARILLKSEWTRLWRLHECATYPDKPVCKRLAEYGKMLGVNVQSRCE